MIGKMLICFIIIFVDSSWSALSMNHDLSLNLKNAISSNIVAKYSLQDRLTSADLKRFFETVIYSKESEDNLGNGTGDIALYESCYSLDNIASCKATLSQKCLDPATLFGPEDSVYLTDTFSALVYRFQSAACGGNHKPDADEAPKSTTEGLAWGYGIGFSILNCFISMVGGCLVPVMKRQMFQRVLLYCVGLGVGTLASAGCLVLLPESLELKGTEYFKMAALLAGIYLFFLSGKIKTHWKLSRKAKEDTKRMQVHVIATDQNLRIILDEPQPDQEIFDLPELRSEDEDASENRNVVKKQQSVHEVSTFAWMLLFGDAFHKFIDGVSVGATFTENIFTGLSLAIAIVLEELPHELGDIAFLLQAGMNVKRALLYNLLAVIPSFFGVSLGIVLGENTNATTWILAIAGGMFIYISCVDMMPEMGEQANEAIEKGTEKP